VRAPTAIAHGCAHSGAVVVGCAEKLTPALEATASAALVGVDYSAAIQKAFADEAACVAVAAVEAAIDDARNLKLAAVRGATTNQTAIELHGQAWLSSHRRS
jgi:hypothetical protein